MLFHNAENNSFSNLFFHCVFLCLGLHLPPFGYHCGFLLLCIIKWYLPSPPPNLVLLCKFLVCMWCTISSCFPTIHVKELMAIVILCCALLLSWSLWFSLIVHHEVVFSLFFPLVLFCCAGLWCMCSVCATTLLSFSSDQ